MDLIKHITEIIKKSENKPNSVIVFGNGKYIPLWRKLIGKRKIP